MGITGTLHASTSREGDQGLWDRGKQKVKEDISPMHHTMHFASVPTKQLLDITNSNNMMLTERYMTACVTVHEHYINITEASTSSPTSTSAPGLVEVIIIRISTNLTRQINEMLLHTPMTILSMIAAALESLPADSTQ